MNTADRITLFTRQDKIVLDTLYECGVARVKQEYVKRKYGSLPNFPAAYSVMRGLMEQTVPRAEGDESPFWLHGTAEATGIYSVDAPLITLSVPRDGCVLFDSRRWNRALNLCYIGSDARDEAAFDAELARLGIAHGSVAFTTPFYPQLKQRIIKSWRERLLLPPDDIRYTQAAVWHIDRSWLISVESPM